MPTYVTLEADTFIDAVVRLLMQAAPSSSGADCELDYYHTSTDSAVRAVHHHLEHHD